MNIKHYALTLLVFLFFTTQTDRIYANNYGEDSLEELENFFSEGFVWDDDEEEFYQNKIKRSTFTEADIENILETIADKPILLQNTLQKDLYKRTNPVNVRPLHDLPALQRYNRNTCFKSDFLGCTFFYNQTRKKFLSKHSPFIESYLTIADPDFLEELDRIDNALQESRKLAMSFDIPIILPLFSKIKLEERRLGGMFDLHGRNSSFEWRIRMPFYYIEHNFFLTEEEQQEIANQPLFQGEIDEFFEQHVVNDMLGIGDLRLEARWDFVESDCVLLTVGAELTIPTGKDIVNGIIGNEMINNPKQPHFDLFEYLCLAQQNINAAKDMAIEFGVGTLDRLARIAGATDMGGNHVGLGALAEYRHWISHDLSIFNKVRLNYLIPRNEIRFFRATKNPTDFDRDYTSLDNTAEDNLNNLKFLSQQFVNTLYPYGISTLVNPGITAQWTIAGHVDTCHWHAEIGYDLWFRGHETLQINPRNLAPPVDVCEGVLFSTHQHKVFTKIFWDKVWCDYDWHIGFVTDITLAQTGIGKSWTIGLDLGFAF